MARAIDTALLFGIFLASGAFSIVLTRLPCYATMCPEDYFSFETTAHIGIYYATLLIFGVLLLLRTHVSIIRSFMGHHLANRIPVVGRRITIGGLLTCFWLVGLTGGLTAIWLPNHLDFWETRTDPVNWLSAKINLTISGVTAHYADILFGLLLIPTSRFSLVGRAFDLHQSTLLFAHKMVSYLFIIATFAHGGAYLSYALDGSSDGDTAREEALATGNPVMTLSESKEKNGWFVLSTETGIAVLFAVIVILLTSLPWVRRNHYNFFYYSHVVFGTLIIIGACLHASTDFYLAIPGLIFWTLDRIFRFRAQIRHKNVVATVEKDGDNWIRIYPELINRKDIPVSEKESNMSDPLQYYYLNFPAVSKLQNHTFTAAIPATTHTGPTFLLQPPGGHSEKRLQKEWTRKLRYLASSPSPSPRGNGVELDISIQGPYKVNDNGYKMASRITCIVGGTGITGACSLVHWWLRNGSHGSFLSVVWTVRQRETANVREWNDLLKESNTNHNLSLNLHSSAESGRLDVYSTLQNDLSGGTASDKRGRGWIYASGPGGLLQATEEACVNMQRKMRNADNTVSCRVQNLSWYIARWEV